MSRHLLLGMFGFKGIGLGMEGGSGHLAIGSFLLVPMLIGFLVTGGVIRVAGPDFPDTGDSGNMKIPERSR